jgi:hypothetical protein
LPVTMEKRKVLRACSRTLPIHAKTGRERGPKARARENGPQDDACLGLVDFLHILELHHYHNGILFPF